MESTQSIERTPPPLFPPPQKRPKNIKQQKTREYVYLGRVFFLPFPPPLSLLLVGEGPFARFYELSYKCGSVNVV